MRHLLAFLVFLALVLPAAAGPRPTTVRLLTDGYVGYVLPGRKSDVLTPGQYMNRGGDYLELKILATTPPAKIGNPITPPWYADLLSWLKRNPLAWKGGIVILLILLFLYRDVKKTW